MLKSRSMMLSEIERASEAQSSVRGVGVFRAAGTLWLIMAALLSLKAGAQEKLPPGGLSLVKVLIETSPTNLLVNGSSRIHVSGVFSDGTTNDITRGANGTTYLSLAPTVVSVDSNGVATGLAAGQASIFIETARGHKSGLSRLITLFVGGNGDTDGDGLPDVFEVANGLNPNDPTDGELDPDRDRLSNLEEFLLGTDPGKEDTDGDGFADGEELQRGSNPTHADFERCTASILNRTGPFDSSGSFLIPNVPVEPGFFRVRVVCEGNGRTVVGQSSFFSLVPAGVPADLIEIHFGVQDAIPVSLRIDSSKTTFVAKGETARCVAIAVLPDRSSKDRTLGTQGTLWSSSNPEIADVSPDGVVTAKARGQAIIQARNEGVLASLTITSLIPNDADSDGMTDEYERANALNPNDASDAAQDSDNDGLTNFQEFQRGTNPRNADTDGDGLTDASEIVRGTDPLRADSDGDGLADGEEVGLGSNPTSKDTDTDGIPDALELRLHLNPVLANPTTTVRGRVSLANGAPVAGATALLFDFLTATTDSNGLFTLAGVPTNLGPVSIVARLIQGNQVFDGFSASTTPVVGGVTDVGAIQLQLNAGTVAGLVIDPAGRPVTGVQITVSSGPDTRTTLTDVLGRYQVGNITAGNIDVTARDYRTGLRARGSGTLPLNASTSMNLQLTAVATITGTVFLQDGTNSAGAGVTVTLLGQGSRNTTTDELGRYTFDFVPLGPFSVEASDPAGSRGRNAGNLSTTGRTVLTDLTFLGRGNATGLVFNGAGSLATNAVVQLRSRSVFGGSATITTGSSNRFAFSNVFVGDFDVTAFVAATRLAGYASGRIDREGQSVALNITVAEAGSFTGTVFRADGSTPVAGAQIILSPTRLSATTDAEGRFRFDFLPLGGYDFDVTDPATGDRGRASGSLVQQDQVQGVDIRLLGFGSILVTVLDGGGKVSPGARVSLSSSSGFDFTRTLTTEANGVARFDDFLSGSFTVAAFDPSTQLSGSTSGTLVAGGTANTIVNLQQAGSISGAIFAADGSNVVANIRLSLGGPVGRQAQSGVDGRFTFNNLPLGTYSIDAHDGADNLRARATGLAVASQGQQLVRNLVLSGVGTVNGTVVPSHRSTGAEHPSDPKKRALLGLAAPLTAGPT
jgi:hypothetical protein